jgi:hypothetical protein
VVGASPRSASNRRPDAYKVLVHGTPVGSLFKYDRIEIPVEPGYRHVRAKIDFFRSREVVLSVDPRETRRILSVPPARLPACLQPVVTYDCGKANSPRRRRPLSDAPNMSSRVRGPGIVEERARNNR